MVPAAVALLWALLLSPGPRAAAGAQGLTSAGTQPVSFRSGSPTTQNDWSTARSSLSPKSTAIVEGEDDIAAAADRVAGPAAAELLASTVSTDVSGSPSWGREDGSLEEGVVINADKNSTRAEAASTAASTAAPASSRFAANVQEPEYRLTTNMAPLTSRAGPDPLLAGGSLTRWTTAGATPRRWPPRSSTAMPAPEDLRLVLLPWGPWHCHCRSGTMSRSRAGKLQGLSGRLRVGALSQLRTEHRPCTYQQCPCDRHREECPLDSGICTGAGCATRSRTPAAVPTTTTTTTTTTTVATLPPLSQRLRPTPLHLLGPNPALDFWRRVRIGLEDIWNSLSSVFAQMQPVSVRR